MGIFAGRLLRDRRGSSLVELLIIVALVALAAIGAFKLFGGAVGATSTRQGDCVASMQDCHKGSDGAGEMPGPLTGVNSAAATAPPADQGNDKGGNDGGGGKSLWDRAKDVGSGFVGAAWDTVYTLGTLGASASPAGRVVAAFGGPDPAGDLVKNIADLGGTLATGYWGELKNGNFMTPDQYVAQTLGPPIWQSIKDSWNENPEKFIGAGIFEIATIVLPTKVSKISWLGKIKTVDKVTDTAKTLDKVGDTAKVVDKASDVSKLAKGFKTKGLEPQYLGEEIPGNRIWGGSPVKYLDDAERQAYKLTVKDGKLYDANGKLFDTAKCVTAHSGCGRAIFVMDEQGQIFASTYQEVAKFHHSSLVGGQPVTGAGELVVENGVVKVISNKSGHYRPSAEMNEQVLKALEAQGVDTSTITRDLWR